MAELKCPHCGQVFTVNESEMDSIVKQIRDREFRHDVDERVAEVTRHLNEQHEAALKIREADVRAKAQEAHEREIKQLEDKLRRAESDNLTLKAAVDAAGDKQKLAVQEAVQALESKNQKLLMTIEGEESRRSLAVQEAVQALESKNQKLLMTIEGEESRRSLAVMQAVDKVKEEKQDLERRLTAEKEKHDVIVAEKDSQIEFYKDLKTKMSTKMVGETLEQHCEIEFNRLRATAFRNAYFEKDNDARTGSKGDYIYRETDESGTEIISIMFEMKNEMDETATKHKNEDFFKELDKDRREKNCEYAVLVSLLESGSELYNAGIVDVSYKFDKMYVVRPQCFIPIITLLRNAAMDALAYKRELAVVRNQNVDITHFEENLSKFKSEFSRNYGLAHDHFNKAIEEIDKTIDHLQKVKAELLGSDNQLRLANNKVDDVSVKKLTRDNPTMQKAFEKVRKAQEE